MIIKTDALGHVLATISGPDEHADDPTVPGDGGHYVLTDIQGIASRMELLGYESIPETLQAMYDMTDPTAADPNDTVWADLYDALETSLKTPKTAVFRASSTQPDQLAQARMKARQRLGLTVSKPRFARAASVNEASLPDGLADAVTQARADFLTQLTPSTEA